MRIRPNRFIGLTYIPDNHRMEAPPEWFLMRIHDYDAELVILPSRLKPFAYVVARRMKRITPKAIEDTITQPDTKMCFKYGLVPVCLMYKHGPVWNADTVLNSLKARDTWAHGGGEALADKLEKEEEAAHAKLLADTHDRMKQLGHDAWHSYQRRTGQRTSVPGPARAGAAPFRPTSSGTATGVTLT